MAWFDTWVQTQILTEPYTVWTGDVIGLCSKTGAKLLKRAYRYVIKAFKCGFSWRGHFSPCHFLVSTDGYYTFEIDLGPVPSTSKSDLFYDFRSLNVGLLKYYEHNMCPALYIPHLRYFTTNPPPEVWHNALYFDRYLDFLRYQFAFAGPNARGQLTDGLATSGNNLMGRLDRADYESIINKAWSMLRVSPNHFRWVSIGALNPIYDAIITFNSPSGHCELLPNPPSLYAMTRHIDVHGAEKTLAELFLPQAPPETHEYVGQDAWAALEAQRKNRAIQAEQAAMAASQPEAQAPGGEQQGQQPLGVEQQGQQAPGGKQKLKKDVRLRLKGNYIQTMINPVELNLMLGHDFGNFIAQATALLIIELDLGIFYAYVHEVYEVYKKSIDNEVD